MQERTQYDNFSRDGAQARPQVLNAFMRGVYAWMFVGLAVTAAMAMFTLSSAFMWRLMFGTKYALLVVIIAELALVFYLSARISKLSAAAATGIFIVYSALNGLMLSSIFLVYTRSSIFQAFVTAAAMFGAMALYGLVTKRDLTGMGSFMMMGLFGLVIATVVNLFIGSNTMSIVLSVIGVIVFTGLTAYDNQRLKDMGNSIPSGLDPATHATVVRRGTIMGALTLYLDFINLFLFLLRLLGNRRS